LTKNAVLEEIAKGTTVEYTKKAKVRIGKSIVHFRYCSPQAAARGKFTFSINPDTLSADYELWICGKAAYY
jgi:hypothetical protein